MNTPEFRSFGKVPRLRRTVVVTEKIDGTNAQVLITLEQTPLHGYDPMCVATVELPPGEDGEVLFYNLYAGSRTRWVTPGKTTDNYGWAAWVRDNAADLVGLGIGRHYGEWWGKGINRGYGIDDRRFSLFNVSAWRDNPERPECCLVVPTLIAPEEGFTNMNAAASAAISELQINGSHAAPRYPNPEGIVVFHTASNHLYKRTLDGDGVPKSLKAVAA